MAKLDLNPGGLAAASVLLTTSLSSSFSLGLPPIQFTPRKQLHIQSMQNTGQVPQSLGGGSQGSTAEAYTAPSAVLSAALHTNG